MADKDNREVIARRLREPKHDLTVNYAVWKAGQRIYRIHSESFHAVEFNPGKGNARFSPMKNGVATLYGGIRKKEVDSEPLSSSVIMAIIEEQADQLGLVLLDAGS